jgi:hypothetical protein
METLPAFILVTLPAFILVILPAFIRNGKTACMVSVLSALHVLVNPSNLTRTRNLLR